MKRVAALAVLAGLVACGGPDPVEECRANLDRAYAQEWTGASVNLPGCSRMNPLDVELLRQEAEDAASRPAE